MSKEGPGPTYCSQKRSVGVKKKVVILSSNYLDQRRITFIWFLYLGFKWAILNKDLWSFPNCLLQLTFRRTNQASSSSVPIMDYSTFLTLTWHFITIQDYQTPSLTWRFRVMQWRNSISCLEPHNYQLLRLVMQHFLVLSRYHFSHHASRLNYVQKI